jgi:hypothetical protein
MLILPRCTLEGVIVSYTHSGFSCGGKIPIVELDLVCSKMRKTISK